MVFGGGVWVGNGRPSAIAWWWLDRIEVEVLGGTEGTCLVGVMSLSLLLCDRESGRFVVNRIGGLGGGRD